MTETTQKLKPIFQLLIKIYGGRIDFTTTSFFDIRKSRINKAISFWKIKELFPNPYSHHEVTIEHPTLKYKDGTPRRFRVDSYTPNIVIVERKATNFDKIQLKTFEGYLQSIKRKYPNGAKIVADDQTIRGSLLNGVQKIEVPKSNLNSKRLKEFQDLANSEKYKIEIIFIDE